MEKLIEKTLSDFEKNYAASLKSVPQSWIHPMPPSFNDVMKGQITSQVRDAHQYFMYSNGPDVGRDYDERKANLQKKISSTFKAFLTARYKEYEKTLCLYYATTQSNAGNTKSNTITAENGLNLIPDSIDRTTSGEWKGGPYYAPDEINPVSVSWTTGGNRTASTYVYIKGKYNIEFIKGIIVTELNIARRELHELGIPTELPPF